MQAMIELTCAFCEQVFLKKKKNFTQRMKTEENPRFFCGLQCAARTKDGTYCNCHTCGIKVYRYGSAKKSKSGFYYCSRSCSASSNNKIYKTKENHPNWVSGRGSYREGRSIDKCVNCGEERYYLLVVHHKDSDRDSNGNDNLEDLCWNCHAMRHLIVKDGKLVVRWGKLTTPEATALMSNLS